MGVDLSILYRGVLSGCNYDCGYCPFAKRKDSKAVLAQDKADLLRFADWAAAQKDKELRILFTPWGEALIRRHYQDVLCVLSHELHIERLSIQTNLSCNLDWAEHADPATLSLWCTYHPGETSLGKFLAQCERLESMNLPYCVGVVGVKSEFDEIEQLRRRLSPKTYLWINAFKDEGRDYYAAEDIDRLIAIDPHFSVNLQDYESLGKPCRAGDSVFSVDGTGDMRRCHFIPAVIGNIYHDNFMDSLEPSLCSRAVCDCHIGYINMAELGLDTVFKGWALGRLK